MKLFGWKVFAAKETFVPVVIPEPVEPSISLTVLRLDGMRVMTEKDRLSDLPIFDADATDLQHAWKKTETGIIEKLLNDGDALTRKSWDDAIGIFNVAKNGIDHARDWLGYFVARSERVLAAYKIDYAAIPVAQSGTLEGEMKVVYLPPKDFMQRLNYTRGTGMAVAKAFTSNGSWQVALAAVAFSAVIAAVNHSKILRQLKELEGQLKEQATAVRGDIQLIAGELSTRMIPQFEGLLALISRFDDEIKSLRDAEGETDSVAADAKAFQLACTMREAQYLLQMKAGN